MINIYKTRAGGDHMMPLNNNYTPPNQDTEVDELLTRFAAKYEASKTIATTENYLKTTMVALNLYYKSILLEVIDEIKEYDEVLYKRLKERLESRLG